MQYIVLCMIIFFCPYSVFAEEEIINVTIDNQEISEGLYIERATGSVYHTVLYVHNRGEKMQKIVIFTEDEQKRRVDDGDVQSLVASTKFHVDTLADEYRDVLEKNNYDVDTFCKKDDDNIKEWCIGNSVAHIEVPPQDVFEVPTTFYFDNDEIDHRAYIILQEDSDINQNEIRRVAVTYHVPDRKIAQVQLKKFSLEKEFSFSDFGMWLRSGMRDDYIAQIGSENNGTEDVQYTYFVDVESVWIGEKVSFSGENNSARGAVQNDRIHVTMPRFGKMRVTGGVSYNDQDQKLTEQRSDPIDLIVWPVHFAIILLLGICFCGICVLLYKYIRKNMFGFRKNKKNNEQFTGTYIVQDTDNIISIAQMFGVPWKDLAEQNKIDPPYILISGETISVPSPQVVTTGVESEDMQNHETLQKNHVEKDVVDMRNVSPVISSKPQALTERIGRAEHIEQRDLQHVTQETQHVQKESLTTQRQNYGPVKPKVKFAGPQSMLAQPASEPTTRAIDIEWMRDDEEAYNEEMEFQRKSVNKRLGIVIAVGVCVIGGFVVWGVMQWKQHNIEEKVSVETLIEEDLLLENEREEMMSSENDDQEAVSDASGEISDVGGDDDKNAVETSEKQEEKAQTTQKTPGEIVVQVLNAGAATGAAGTVSTDIKNKGYKTNSAQNAQNSYSGVIIYYAAEMKEHADAIAQVVDAKYGTQTKEESVDVTGKYKADIVVVLGT